MFQAFFSLNYRRFQSQNLWLRRETHSLCAHFCFFITNVSRIVRVTVSFALSLSSQMQSRFMIDLNWKQKSFGEYFHRVRRLSFAAGVTAEHQQTVATDNDTEISDGKSK